MPKREARILGLDPGLARVGFALVAGNRHRPRLVRCGTLTTRAGRDPALRLQQLAIALQRLLTDLKPTRVALERLFFQRNVSTALAVSEARGVLRLVCAQSRLPASEFTPTAVKQSLTGTGRADKRAVLKMVRLLLGPGAPLRDDDAADAVAVALTALSHPYGS